MAKGDKGKLSMEIKIRFYTAEELRSLIEILSRNGYKVSFDKRDEGCLTVKISNRIVNGKTR